MGSNKINGLRVSSLHKGVFFFFSIRLFIDKYWRWLLFSVIDEQALQVGNVWTLPYQIKNAICILTECHIDVSFDFLTQNIEKKIFWR